MANPLDMHDRVPKQRGQSKGGQSELDNPIYADPFLPISEDKFESYRQQ